MIERTIHQEEIKIINEYAPNKRTLKYMKEKWTELKGEISNYTII